MQTQKSLLQTFLGVVARPVDTFRQLQEDNRAAFKAFSTLLFVIIVYTLILGIFIFRDYPAMAPSVLSIAVEEQYYYQIWYQGPLFLLATLIISVVLLLITRMIGQATDFATLFARVTFATTVPFAMTTMIVELIIAILLLIGLFHPYEVLGWLTGRGSWFMNAYQIVAGLWVSVLSTIAVRSTTGVKWWLSVALGILLVIIYAVPIGLFIR